jgi:hypothetical protein
VSLILIFFLCLLDTDTKSKSIRIDSTDDRLTIVKEKTIQQEYVDYSVNQFDLKPLRQQKIVLDYPLLLGSMIINDVLSFQYVHDVGFDLMENTCLKWSKDEQLKHRVNTTLLVIVISAVDNFERRRMIRESWASKDGVMVAGNSVQVVFLVGLSSNQSTTLTLKNESIVHRDIIQVNVNDAYSNLTSKSVAFLHWAHTHCPKVDWVLKCDDDNYVNGKFLLTLLNQLATKKGSDFSIYGKIVPTLIPERKKSMIHQLKNRICYLLFYLFV